MTGREHHGIRLWMRPYYSFFLLTVSCLLLAVLLVSCGRRGDPVLPDPHEAIDSPEQSGIRENETLKQDVSGTVDDALTVMQPKAPTGLAAVFADQKIILVWDEVAGQGVNAYRIYRSAGDVFSLIGETAVPVFNDRDIESGTRYYYKVSAVGQTESGGSESVEVVAGGD